MSSTSRDGLLALCGSLLGLSIPAVGFRFYARKRQQLPYLPDDWLVVVALLSYLGASICIFLLVRNKEFGDPNSTTALSENSDLLQVALDILSNTTLTCTKLSAVFFYRRIFVTGTFRHKRTAFDILTIATIIVLVLWYVVFQFLVGFQCGTHFTALWSADYTKYCTISEPFLIGLAISDFLLEVWILALPIPSVLRLQANKPRKVSIIGVFLLAFIGLGASIARMAAYIDVKLDGKKYLIPQNFERVLTQVFYLTMLEAGMNLVAVNLPTLWSLHTLPAVTTMLNSLQSLRSRISTRRGSVRSREASMPSSIRMDRVTTIHTSDLPAPKAAYLAHYDSDEALNK